MNKKIAIGLSAALGGFLIGAYVMVALADLTQPADNPPTGGGALSGILQISGGNIGIGLPSGTLPTSKLDINGTLSAGTANIIWPVIIIIAGLKKMMGGHCKCC